MRGAFFRASKGCRAIAAGAVLVAMAAPAPANADPEGQYGWREVWSGADVSSHVWLLYSGATIAPYSHIFADGLRLRVAAGYGRYSYVGERIGGVQSFKAETGYAEALVGYLKRLGPVTAKAFVGVSAIEHNIAPFDIDNPVQGQEIGPKVAAEIWINLGSKGWSSADAWWTSAHSTAAARVRGGYRIYDDISLGLEGGINANDLGEDTRAGLFARYAWEGGEVSLSGGYSGRFLDDAQALRDPYATVNWLTQF